MHFDSPIVITNFKTYKEATGTNALELAKQHERLANELQINLAIAGQAVDLQMLAAGVSIPVLAQHVDPVTHGAYTGHLPPDVLKPLGVDGSLLNHSERRLPSEMIADAVSRLRENGMFVVICAETASEGFQFMQQFNPDYIAIEPPELIGGEVSVSNARPELIKEAVQMIGAGKVLVGAGVKNGEDVRVATELGAVGILVASGVVKAENPAAVLRDLCSGFKKS
ncbi:triose-phosphate isomerase [Patescibacteria group bacterium]|nr:triose-phosphate isomerase [Patescibacteria group bacterium]